MKKILGILMISAIGYSANSVSADYYPSLGDRIGSTCGPTGQPALVWVWNPLLGRMELVPAAGPVYTQPVWRPVYGRPIWRPGFRRPLWGPGFRHPWGPPRWAYSNSSSSSDDDDELPPINFDAGSGR